MVEKVDQVTLGIGQGISAEELAASVHDCSIDELRAAKAFAAGRQQGLREAAGKCLEVSGLIGAAHGSSIDSALREAAAVITALIEGEGR